MKTNTFHTEKYTVDSYGNGWAYAVTCHNTGCSFFVQDDDASQLQTNTGNFENDNILDDYMETIGRYE